MDNWICDRCLKAVEVHGVKSEDVKGLGIKPCYVLADTIGINEKQPPAITYFCGDACGGLLAHGIGKGQMELYRLNRDQYDQLVKVPV